MKSLLIFILFLFTLNLHAQSICDFVLTSDGYDSNTKCELFKYDGVSKSETVILKGDNKIFQIIFESQKRIDQDELYKISKKIEREYNITWMKIGNIYVFESKMGDRYLLYTTETNNFHFEISNNYLKSLKE